MHGPPANPSDGWSPEKELRPVLERYRRWRGSADYLAFMMAVILVELLVAAVGLGFILALVWGK